MVCSAPPAPRRQGARGPRRRAFDVSSGQLLRLRRAWPRQRRAGGEEVPIIYMTLAARAALDDRLHCRAMDCSEPGARTRRSTPAVVLALVATAALSAVSPAAQSKPGNRPPNIIFILADDLGVNDLGVYGRRDHYTPNLDRF